MPLFCIVNNTPSHSPLIAQDLSPRFWTASPVLECILEQFSISVDSPYLKGADQGLVLALIANHLLQLIIDSEQQRTEALENITIFNQCNPKLEPFHVLELGFIAAQLWESGHFVVLNQLCACTLHIFPDNEVASNQLLNCAGSRVASKVEAASCLIPICDQFVRNYVHALRYEYAGANSPY